MGNTTNTITEYFTALMLPFISVPKFLADETEGKRSLVRNHHFLLKLYVEVSRKNAVFSQIISDTNVLK